MKNLQLNIEQRTRGRDNDILDGGTGKDRIANDRVREVEA